MENLVWKLLKPVDRKILESLGETFGGSISFYDCLKKKIGAHSSILNSLNNLVELNLITRGEQGKRNRIPYKLTLLGETLVDNLAHER